MVKSKDRESKEMSAACTRWKTSDQIDWITMQEQRVKQENEIYKFEVDEEERLRLQIFRFQ